MISGLKAFLYRHPPLRRAAESARDTLKRLIFLVRTSGIRGDGHSVVFCSYLGRQYACSPKAIYEYMLGDEKYADYTFVWAFRDVGAFEDIPADEVRTKKVVYLSAEFDKEMSKAGYWIFNARVPAYIRKRKDQTYIQTWHGTPLKRLGLDVKGYITGADDIKSLHKSFRSDGRRMDVLISPSPFYTEAMSGAFGLNGSLSQKVRQLGYPRNDALYHADDIARLEIRVKLGIPEGARVILYAPTWRETSLDASKGSTYSAGLKYDSGLDMAEFIAKIPRDVVVLLRTHYFVAAHAACDGCEDRIIDVSDYPDINELYIASDMLMTDYSSVMFDFAILGRPMLFYMYDLESYRNIRDWYFPIEELPGDIITREENLPQAVERALEGNEAYGEKALEFAEKYYPMGGDSAKRVCESLL